MQDAIMDGCSDVNSSTIFFHVSRSDLLSDLPSFDRVKGALAHHSLDKLSRSQVCSYS